MNSLALDSSGYDNNPALEDWANEYGYHLYDMEAQERSRIKKMFSGVEKERNKLNTMLGDDLYEELLYKTESL